MSAGIADISTNIKQARLAKSLTQKELGQRVGLPQSHISKIEKGVVDLQLSSLIEIVRALDLDVKLVPRKAIPAVDGAVRLHSPSPETSRAIDIIRQNAQFAERLKVNHPNLTQIEGLQQALKNVPKIRYDAAQIKTLQDALKPITQLQEHMQAIGKVLQNSEFNKVGKQLQAVTKSLNHFRNLQIHNPQIEIQRQLPAHRLEEDEL